MLVINILQGLLGRGPIFLNLHQLYGLYLSLEATTVKPTILPSFKAVIFCIKVGRLKVNFLTWAKF